MQFLRLLLLNAWRSQQGQEVTRRDGGWPGFLVASLESADHHVLTVLSYFRDHLMGAELYQDWVEAGQMKGGDKFEVTWKYDLQYEKPPRENYRNLTSICSVSSMR